MPIITINDPSIALEVYEFRDNNIMLHWVYDLVPNFTNDFKQKGK